MEKGKWIVDRDFVFKKKIIEEGLAPVKSEFYHHLSTIG